MPVAPYGTDAYRAWNRERMVRYRKTATMKLIDGRADRAKDRRRLLAERERVLDQLREKEKECLSLARTIRKS